MRKKIQLFCIPYAGGNADLFDTFASEFQDDVEVIKIEYAGHGARRKEPFYLSFQEMVEDVAVCINRNLKQEAELALFGYSMGSIVAYEIFAQHLLERELNYLFLASHEAPDVEWESKKYFHLDEEQFFSLIQQMGGFEKCSVEMLKNRFFRKLHFEPVRADYELLCHYVMSRKEKIDIPSILFYSAHDIPKEKILSWNTFLTEKSKVIEIGENHFFIREYGQDMQRMMEEMFYKE